MTLRLDVDATDGPARAAVVTTARGSFRTPCFMPVGTRAAVRLLSSVDLEDLGVETVLANAYHLMMRPGAATVAAAGGLHRFMGWTGHVLTDSGGFQVFSLGPRVDDDGVIFRSPYDGTRHRLTPEGAVELQVALGADIQMVLDVCPPLPAPVDVVRLAVERTAAWAARARDAHRRAAGDGQALFGIVQGGADEGLRAESARRTVEVGFDGYGVGGLSVGEGRDETLAALAAAVAELPPDRPRYLMGVGDPVGLLDAIALGVDLFDCVLPTRLARHGTVFTAGGRIRLTTTAHAGDDRPLDPDCPCAVCRRWSRVYIRHLFKVREQAGPRLVTLHNLAWTLTLVERARAAVAEGRLGRLRAEVAEAWTAGAADRDRA